jgi:hypothetical protein
MTPFRQVGYQDRQPAPELAPIAAPHTLDLLGYVADIDRGQLTRAQQATLLDGPSVEVLFLLD